MKIIKDYVDIIDEELEDAKKYAEMYVEFKARNKDNHYWIDRFSEIAYDELKHAEYIHELAINKIDELRNVYMPPANMQEMWNETHKNYVEKASWIKQMLTM